jgi:hypothetical protein
MSPSGLSKPNNRHKSPSPLDLPHPVQAKHTASAPWLNWIEQPPPKGQVIGSNPIGVTSLTDLSEEVALSLMARKLVISPVIHHVDQKRVPFSYTHVKRRASALDCANQNSRYTNCIARRRTIASPPKPTPKVPNPPATEQRQSLKRGRCHPVSMISMRTRYRSKLRFKCSQQCAG